MKLLHNLFLFLVVFTIAPICFGQSGQTDTPRVDDQGKPKKQYQVEIIAFQYSGPDSSGGEEFETLLVEDYFPPEPFDIDEYNRVREAISYTQMTHLSGALEKLRLDPLYTVLLDVAWIQPLLDKGEAVEVPVGYEARNATYSLHAGSVEPVAARLSGSVSVYGDYLLFVDVDLRLVVPRPNGDRATTEGTFGLSTFTGVNIEDSTPTGKFDVFRISEKRRIKLDEFHYFDHPRIGAIVSVTRYEKNQKNVSTQ